MIPCQVPDSIPPAFVQFLKDGDPVRVSDSGTDTGSRILNGDTLLLTNVSAIHSSGNYSCIASNHITDERRIAPNVATLIITDKSRNEKSRLIHQPKDNYQIKHGEAIFIPCAASGVPKPEIIWTRMAVGGGAENLTQIIARNGVMEVVNAQQSNTGHYMCAVFNGARRFVRRTSVTVLIPPEFVSTPEAFVSFPDDTTLELRCQASGSPPPIIVWTFNGLPVQAPALVVNRLTGTLVIPNAKAEEHSGFYQCFAQNTAGQIVRNTFVTVGNDILAQGSVIISISSTDS